jgi:signal transduction histidine kinase
MPRENMVSEPKKADSRLRQLRYEIATRDARLRVLARIASGIHRERDDRKILEIGLDAVLSELGLATGWVFLGNETEKKLRMAASRGISPVYLADIETKGLQGCLCPEVFESGHRMLARNTTQCPRMPDIIAGLKTPVAHACIPLRFDGASRGVLNVAARPGETFADDELTFLETVGHQLCLALERAEHGRAENARLQEARALASINRAIGSSLDLQAVLHTVGDTARVLIGSDRALLFLGSDARRLRLAYVSGAPIPGIQPGQEIDIVALGSRLLRRALTEPGTYVVEDWSTDDRVHRPLAEEWGMGAGIVTGLRVQNQTRGMMLLSRLEPWHWAAGAIELVEALADQAAVAIENAQLYEERRRAYQELKDAQARMIQSEKLAAVGTFASGLAHEVRNPLNSVALQLSLLERRAAPLEEKVSSEIKELVRIIREEVRRLDGLVSDFLELSRAGRLQRRPTDLDALLDDVARLLRPEARNQGVTLRRLPLGQPLTEASLDAEKIKQVVINLVRNAIEAMPEGGSVIVESGALDGAAVVRVRDTGPGLPEGLDVFQLFVTSKPGGTGLGLSIAQQIVLEHGGELSSESAPGKGATFTIRLPLPSGQAAE